MKTWLISTAPQQPETYKGLAIHADEGLHGQLAVHLADALPAGATILDLGAGSGALALRLTDQGFRLTAADIDAARFQAASVPFVLLDLDAGIGNGLDDRQFDAVCAIEVIEHVRDPWRLLTDCHRLLKPGGLLVISTPNITSFYSRLLFLYKGRFHLFEDADRSYGHIRPIGFAELEMVAADCGFKVVGRHPGGYLPLLTFPDWRPKRWLQNLVRLLVYPFMQGPKDGTCLIYLLRKAA